MDKLARRYANIEKDYTILHSIYGVKMFARDRARNSNKKVYVNIMQQLHLCYWNVSYIGITQFCKYIRSQINFHYKIFMLKLPNAFTYRSDTGLPVVKQLIGYRFSDYWGPNRHSIKILYMQN